MYPVPGRKLGLLLDALTGGRFYTCNIAHTGVQVYAPNEPKGPGTSVRESEVPTKPKTFVETFLTFWKTKSSQTQNSALVLLFENANRFFLALGRRRGEELAQDCCWNIKSNFEPSTPTNTDTILHWQPGSWTLPIHTKSTNRTDLNAKNLKLHRLHVLLKVFRVFSSSCRLERFSLFLSLL